MGIFSRIRRRTKNKAIFCGLDNSGKSTIISFLQTGRFVEHTPTMGKVKQQFEIDGTKLSIFDIGGQSHFRKLWLGELGKDTKVVVFVIDRADTDRFSEARKELNKLVPLIKKKNVKLLVFANKTDLPTAAPFDMIYENFCLEDLDSYEICETSAKTGYGMADAFIKFYNALTGERLRKNVLADAVSIYDKGGVPLATRARSTQEISEEVLQGGFLSAISSFANQKMGNTCVKFESEDTGTFIIKSSENYIGALLWTDHLDIPISESEDALGELLEHLEGSIRTVTKEKVNFYVNQYCSNLM